MSARQTHLPHGALNFGGTTTRLPEIEEIEGKTWSGEPLNAIERFVANHQPQIDADAWRCELQAVLDEMGGRR